jgi:lysozyme family protein
MYLMKPMSITVKSSFFEDAVNFVLENEGKDHAVNDPNDSGGLTKFGISQHFNPQVNVANLTLEGAMDIYRSKYWAAFPFDEIKSKTVAIKLFDCSVLFGLGNMKKFVNAILKLHSKQEKAYVSYPKELVQEINNISPDLLLALLENVVHKHIKHITAKKPTLRRFFKGWSLRVDRMPI